jgi:hypothetical protein
MTAMATGGAGGEGGGGGGGPAPHDAADDEENAFFARLAAERTGVDFGDDETASSEYIL